MKRDLSLFIDDIIENIVLIENSTKGASKNLFRFDADKRDATLRRLEIIGEAVKNLPESFRKKHPKIPWKDIAGFRDKLTHAYFGVDLERVWNIIKQDIPVLKKQMKKIKEELKNEK